MTTDMRAQFLATLRENVDAWYAGEIDYATFHSMQVGTWEAIRRAGAQVEFEVLRALRDQLPTENTSADAKAIRAGLRYRR